MAGYPVNSKGSSFQHGKSLGRYGNFKNITEVAILQPVTNKIHKLTS